VPLYLHHRYQIEATATSLGGMLYTYALRGDGREPVRMVPGADQRAALRALTAALAPGALALPEPLLKKIPPRPPGYGRTRELFPRYTGLMFDAITPAVVAAEHIVGSVLTADRAARLVEQQMFDPTLPGLDDVIDALYGASFGAMARSPYEAEVKRAVERAVVDGVMDLAESAAMPQVRAVATQRLQRQQAALTRLAATPAAAQGKGDVAAHAGLLAADIKRFLERPAGAVTRMASPAAPPGAPIGEPAMDWLSRFEPLCSWMVSGWR
jgi:hypothetical protein